MGKLEEDLKEIITTLSSVFEKESKEKNAENIEKLKGIYNSDKKMFLTKIEMAQFNFARIISNVIDIPGQKNKYILEHVLSGLYEHFIKKYIEKVEGSPCCADKSGFVKSSTLKALRSNQNLSLYNDYSQCDRITDDKERQAYWSPKTIKDTDTAMEMFWDWYLIRIGG